jgi:putative flippase GtrA
VRLVRLIAQRWRSLAHEMLKFGIVGGINTLVDFLVFNVLLPIGPLKANVVSTVVATTTSYGMNRNWTYRDRARNALRREYVLFFLFNLAGFVIQSAVLGVVKYGLHFTEDTGRIALNVGKAAGIGVAMVFRFWAYRTFVFRVEQVAVEQVAVEQVAVEQVAEVTADPPAGEDEFAQLTGALEADLAEAELDAELDAGLEVAELADDVAAAEVARSR